MLAQDRVVVVDWPHAWIGASHCDTVTLLSSAAVSGIDPAPIAAVHPLTRHLEPERIDGMLALHSGFLLRSALEPDLLVADAPGSAYIAGRPAQRQRF